MYRYSQINSSSILKSKSIVGLHVQTIYSTWTCSTDTKVKYLMNTQFQIKFNGWALHVYVEANGRGDHQLQNAWYKSQFTTLYNVSTSKMANHDTLHITDTIALLCHAKLNAVLDNALYVSLVYFSFSVLFPYRINKPIFWHIGKECVACH